MSDSVRLHRRQPTRLRCPWDSPGSNTGVGCHFLLQCMKVKIESQHLWRIHVDVWQNQYNIVKLKKKKEKKVKSLSCRSSRLHGLKPTRLLHPWDFPGKSTEWGAIAFYQTIALISQTSKLMLKFPHAMLQQYINQILPYAHIGFTKCRGTRDQIANIH